MRDPGDHVERQYAREDLLGAIVGALHEMGKDPSRLTPADLAPVDAFHIRGREATVELAALASLTPGLHVLDVGSGLGGSARYLAAEHRVRVTGVDLTGDYVAVARALADMVGLGSSVEFRQGSALDMPLADGSFDLAWTEHVQMNVPDKRAFYAEIARVLVAGGRLVFHDVFQGDGGPVHFPVPWAEDPSTSFLVTPEAARGILADSGFRIRAWADKSRQSLEWFRAGALKRSRPLPLGLHLLMGRTARAKVENVVRNLDERRIVVLLGAAERA